MTAERPLCFVDTNVLVYAFEKGSSPKKRVAERLMTGDSPEQAATFLEVKTGTVRWHLASMYRKTGTNRQAELVRLLLSLAMI